MKFAIWGIGYRGEKLIKYLGVDKVEVFIDADIEKQNKFLGGINVISPEEYAKSNFNSFVIYTPSYHSYIDWEIIQRKIGNISNLYDMPSEFAGYGSVNYKILYKEILNYDVSSTYLYGINAFSLILNDFYYDKYKKYLPFIAENYCDKSKIYWAKEQKYEVHEINDVNKDNASILNTTTDVVMTKYSVSDLFFKGATHELYHNYKVDNIKNKYLGQKCFVVATGPSLKSGDLNKLEKSGVFCFGVNKIIDYQEWKPDCYVAMDSAFLKSNIDKIEKYDVSYVMISGEISQINTENKNMFNLHVIQPDYKNNFIGFSNDIAQYIDGGKTVTYACIQIAVYMGFKEIYLLGVDCNYKKGSADNYFIKDEKIDNLDHNTEGMIKCYQLAKNYADKHDIKIYNATRGGMLEVFERVDFDTLFEG